MTIYPIFTWTVWDLLVFITGPAGTGCPALGLDQRRCKDSPTRARTLSLPAETRTRSRGCSDNKNHGRNSNFSKSQKQVWVSLIWEAVNRQAGFVHSRSVNPCSILTGRARKMEAARGTLLWSTVRGCTSNLFRGWWGAVRYSWPNVSNRKPEHKETRKD